MPTLYVDPGNAASSDSHNYTQAQDPTTPLASWPAALALLQSNDTINMVDDVTDPHFQFPQLVALSPILATGVTVQGADADTQWHCRNMHLRGITRWTFRNLVTSGNTQGDLSEIDACSNMTFENWEAQRGGANILSALGDWLWDGGSVQAPLDAPATSFLDGVGWRIYVTFESTSGIGNVEFRDHEFSNVQGEDGCQFLAGTTGHTGELRFTRCYWHDFVQSDQANAPHTDGVQIIGANHVIFDSPRFEAPMPSMIISSDDYVQHLELINGKFSGDSHGGFSTQFFGCFRITARNCTWEGSGFGGLRVGYDSRLSATNPVGGGDDHLVIDVANCIIDKLGWTEGIDNPLNPQAATITTTHNLLGPGSPIGDDDVEGFAEYGHTDDTTLELATTPPGTNASAIDAGLSHSDDALVPLLDRLGRARKGSGTDLGCHESDPDVDVVVDPRPIRVIGTSPSASAIEVARNTSVQVFVFPRPGVHIDPDTVTADSFFIVDPGGTVVPAESITVTAPDGGNVQNLILSFDFADGTFYPYNVYTATATVDITDTEGSTLAVELQWHFTILGTAPDPAIGYNTDGGGGGEPDSSTFMTAGFLRDATTRALIVRVAD